LEKQMGDSVDDKYRRRRNREINERMETSPSAWNDLAMMRCALLWLRNHYDVGRPELKERVLEVINEFVPAYAFGPGDLEKFRTIYVGKEKRNMEHIIARLEELGVAEVKRMRDANEFPTNWAYHIRDWLVSKEPKKD
jgi:hypothetical protein